MEEAQELLGKLEALKQQVLTRYPEAASGASPEGEGLPGQVAESEKPPEEHRAAAGEADQKSAVISLVQAELAKRMDTLRSQVWRQIVREELERMVTGDPASSELQSGDQLENVDADEGKMGDKVSRGHHEHRTEIIPGLPGHPHAGHHHEHARQHPHHHQYHDGVYNADYVLGAVDGYRQSPRHGRSRSAARSPPAETPHDPAQDGDRADPESNGHPPEGEGANAEDGEPKAGTDDDEADEDDDWVSVSQNAYGERQRERQRVRERKLSMQYRENGYWHALILLCLCRRFHTRWAAIRIHPGGRQVLVRSTAKLSTKK